MAELHIIGQILGATEFDHEDLFCYWSVWKGQPWTLINGIQKSQTHVVSKQEDGMFIWAHPIDIQYSANQVTGWPKIILRVWYQDQYNRNDFAGYGVVNVPTTAGMHDLEVVCWRPYVGLFGRLKEYIMGGKHQLKNESLVWSVEDRRKLKTISVGKVHFRLNILETFSKKGVVLDENTRIKTLVESKKNQ